MGAAVGVAILLLAAAEPSHEWPTWASEILPNGWTAEAWSQGTVLLVRPAIQVPAPAYRRIWVRYENQTATDGFTVSQVAFEEVDCAQRRIRMLQLTDYSARNMGGDERPLVYQTPVWSFATPGTLGDLVVSDACQPQHR